MTIEKIAQTINAWEVAQSQFDLAAERLNLSPGLRCILREPKRSGSRGRPERVCRVRV